MPIAATDGIGPAERSGTRWGWGLCWLMFASTALSYMDRQAVAVVDKQIAAEFHIRFEDFGWVIAAFYLPYALFQVPAGMLADRWDVRGTYAAAVVWWSLAAMAVAWSPTLGALMAFRAVLGVGESFNWPCALRVTAIVLPPADRGLGNGIFNSGAAVGAVLTPLIVAPLTNFLGWRVAFALIGASGLIWVATWVMATYGPARPLFVLKRRALNPRVPPASSVRWTFAGLLATSAVAGVVGHRFEATELLAMPGQGGRVVAWAVAEGDHVRRGDELAEVELLGERRVLLARGDATVSALARPGGDHFSPGESIGLLRVRPLGLSALWLAIAFLMAGLLVVARAFPADRLGTGGWEAGLGEVVRLRRFWVLLVVSISINVCWHFLVNWLPTYLKTDRGMAFVAGSLLSALPFLAADAGNLGGGAASRWLAMRGMNASRARGIVLTACVLMIAPGALVGSVRGDAAAIAILALMALGTAAFMANYFAYCQEVAPARTGLVVGLLGAFGNLFAAGFAPIAGRIKDTTGGFAPVFLVVGLLPFVGLAAIVLGWGRDRETDSIAGRGDESRVEEAG